MKVATQPIPDVLIYEMINGTPIYYKGYRDYLKGKKQLDEIMGSSKFQAYLVFELSFLIRMALGKGYLIFTSELGLQFSKKSWRAADIAVMKKERFKTKLNDKYLELPPEYVIEIDTKADFSNFKDSTDYFHKKTQALLDFGVQKVVWIFTNSQRVMIATKDSTKWELYDWNQVIEFVPGLEINIQTLLDESGLE